jgi:hypothetical protein
LMPSAIARSVEMTPTMPPLGEDTKLSDMLSADGADRLLSCLKPGDASLKISNAPLQLVNLAASAIGLRVGVIAKGW